jgi:hypothetical protein
MRDVVHGRPAKNQDALVKPEALEYLGLSTMREQSAKIYL